MSFSYKSFFDNRVTKIIHIPGACTNNQVSKATFELYLSLINNAIVNQQKWMKHLLKPSSRTSKPVKSLSKLLTNNKTVLPVLVIQKDRTMKIPSQKTWTRMWHISRSRKVIPMTNLKRLRIFHRKPLMTSSTTNSATPKYS